MPDILQKCTYLLLMYLHLCCSFPVLRHISLVITNDFTGHRHLVHANKNYTCVVTIPGNTALLSGD